MTRPNLDEPPPHASGEDGNRESATPPRLATSSSSSRNAPRRGREAQGEKATADDLKGDGAAKTVEAVRNGFQQLPTNTTGRIVLIRPVVSMVHIEKWGRMGQISTSAIAGSRHWISHASSSPRSTRSGVRARVGRANILDAVTLLIGTSLSAAATPTPEVEARAFFAKFVAAQNAHDAEAVKVML